MQYLNELLLFSVQVVSSGSAQGPAGVTLYLHLSQDDNSPYIQETVTQEGGFYLFTPVHAGRYWVRASHPIWKFEKDVVQASKHCIFIWDFVYILKVFLNKITKKKKKKNTILIFISETAY